MSIFRLVKKDNMMLTAAFLIIGVFIAFFTIMSRLESCDLGAADLKTDFTFKIKQISFIKLSPSVAKVLLVLPSVPEFSDDFQDYPYVVVNWTIKTRGDEIYSGSSKGVFEPAYDSFIFSVQPGLEDELRKTHSEEIFLTEYRHRIIRDALDLEVEIVHPETGEVLETFVQDYIPELRKKDSWAID